MNQIEQLLVVKRSGELVEFDSVRILNAINAAINAGSEEESSKVDTQDIVDNIEEEIFSRFSEIPGKVILRFFLNLAQRRRNTYKWNKQKEKGLSPWEKKSYDDRN